MRVHEFGLKITRGGLGRSISDPSSTNGDEKWMRIGVGRKCGNCDGVASPFQIGGMSSET
jgi:hypothetical protein